MVSRINRRKESKIGLQVRLGVGDLHLGEDLCQGGVAFAGVRQKLENFEALGSPRRIDLHLGKALFA